MAEDALELEHLVRLRQDFRDAIAQARTAGAAPADALVCLARALGEVLAQAGYQGVGPALMVQLGDSIRNGCAEERDRLRRTAEDHPPAAVYRSGGARRPRR